MSTQNQQPAAEAPVQQDVKPKEKKKRRNLKKARVQRALEWFAKHT